MAKSVTETQGTKIKAGVTEYQGRSRGENKGGDRGHQEAER